MSTTTIRIDEALRERVTAAAERAGKSAHAFILEAITEMVERTEAEAAFHRIADARWAKVLASGKTVAWEEARTYVESRAAGGKRVRRPAARRAGG